MIKFLKLMKVFVSLTKNHRFLVENISVLPGPAKKGRTKKKALKQLYNDGLRVCTVSNKENLDKFQATTSMLFHSRFNPNE